MEGIDVLTVREVIRTTMEMRYELRRTALLMTKSIAQMDKTLGNMPYVHVWERRYQTSEYGRVWEIRSWLYQTQENLRKQERALYARENALKAAFANIFLVSAADKAELEESVKKVKVSR